MFPISVDPSWYDKHWYRDANNARFNRKFFARIAIFLVAVCVVGLLGSLALIPTRIDVDSPGFRIHRLSDSMPQVAIIAQGGIG